jgi:PIN domain nuclease of toxin-antitoxin system
MSYLLDTHVLVRWVNGGGGLSRRQRAVLDRVSEGPPLAVADISLWEVAMLVSLGRLRLALPLREWLERAVAPPRVRLVPITPTVAAEVASLPESFHRDPADRILVATARILGAKLLTSDERIQHARLVPTIG